MHEVPKEQTPDVVLLDLSAHRQVTKDLVNADLEVVLTSVLHYLEKLLSGTTNRRKLREISKALHEKSRTGHKITHKLHQVI